MRRAAALLMPLALFACDKGADTSPPSDAGASPADVDDTAADEEVDEEEEVEEEEPEPAGPAPLNKSNFEATVNEHMQEVVDCYAEAVSANAKLKGTLNAAFNFAADGSLSSISAEDDSTLKDQGLIDCIQAKASNWEFGPTPSGEDMTLDFPFNLEPG